MDQSQAIFCLIYNQLVLLFGKPRPGIKYSAPSSSYHPCNMSGPLQLLWSPDSQKFQKCIYLSIIHSTIVFYTKQLRMQSDSGQVLQEASLESTVQYSRGDDKHERAVGSGGTKSPIAPTPPYLAMINIKSSAPRIYFDLPPCLHVGQGGGNICFKQLDGDCEFRPKPYELGTHPYVRTRSTEGSN